MELGVHRRAGCPRCVRVDPPQAKAFALKEQVEGRRKLGQILRGRHLEAEVQLQVDGVDETQNARAATGLHRQMVHRVPLTSFAVNLEETDTTATVAKLSHDTVERVQRTGEVAVGSSRASPCLKLLT